jgi:hypothetical protein
MSVELRDFGNIVNVRTINHVMYVVNRFGLKLSSKNVYCPYPATSQSGYLTTYVMAGLGVAYYLARASISCARILTPLIERNWNRLFDLTPYMRT